MNNGLEGLNRSTPLTLPTWLYRGVLVTDGLAMPREELIKNKYLGDFISIVNSAMREIYNLKNNNKFIIKY